MKRFFLMWLALGVFAAPAMADKAAYCQAYARDFSDQATTDKTLWQHKFQIALDACLAQGKQTAKPSATKKKVASEPAPKPEKAIIAKTASTALVAGTPEWNDYCTKKYTSFIPKTGMYLSKTGVARKCLVTPDFKG